MANSREDSSDAPNPNPDHNANPISEMRSQLLATTEQLKTIMNQLIELRESRPSAEPKLCLPRFNPEIAGSDPVVWCATVSAIMEKCPLQDKQLYLAIYHALQGTAAWLLKQVPADDLTWAKFKEYFLLCYGGTETATSALMRIFNETPLNDETTGAFGNRLRSLLSARWENVTIDEIINAVVLFRLISYDQRVEQIALTNNIQTQDQFHKEMRAFSRSRTSLVPSSNNPSAKPEAKRSKPSNLRTKCYYCGITGHKTANCRKRMRIEKQKNT